MTSRKPEILAPAGSWEALHAAAAAGADAVYFGLSKFSARKRAANFAPEDLGEVMAYLRARNVRGYVAVNTLVYAEELPQAAEYIETIARAGADAIIMQDLGLARLAHTIAPSLPIHASTQMTVTHPAALRPLRELGVTRVILARELSLAELRSFRDQAEGMELEVFVHGALCMSYSGQCLASESLFGRSANRGACDQPCRLPYKLFRDGQEVNLGRRQYLLSPKDLAAWEHVGQLAELGVAGLKIEGRLKGPNYVAAVVGFYRAAVDAAAGGKKFKPTQQQRLQLELSFSRGFTTGFLGGAGHKELVHGLYPDSRGLAIGHVTSVWQIGSARITVELDRAGVGIAAGDGLVIGDDPTSEQGGRVYQVSHEGKDQALEIAFAPGHIDTAMLAVGQTVWKTDDPAVRRAVESSIARDMVVNRQAVDAELWAEAGLPLRLALADSRSNRVEVTSDEPLAAAQRQPLTAEAARSQVDRLGDTPFALGKLDCHITGQVMVPKSLLNQLRRQACEQLTQLQAERSSHEVAQPRALGGMRDGQHRPDAAASSAVLSVLARTVEQAEAAVEFLVGQKTAGGAGLLYGDFREHSDLLQAARLAGQAGVGFAPATLRILKPGQEAHIDRLLECQPAAVLVRNLATLEMLVKQAPNLPLVGDASLNLANDLAAWLLAGNSYGTAAGGTVCSQTVFCENPTKGEDTVCEQTVPPGRTPEGGCATLSRLTPAIDLNWPHLAGMLAFFPAWRLEVILHQHVPMFHMQHCLAAANSSSEDCGQACRRQLSLQDRKGESHPVLFDAACRNTVFRGRAQSAGRYLPAMRQAGLAHFRLELLDESPAQVKTLCRQYAALLAGDSAEPVAAPGGTWDFE